jgi:hypothetical protein
MEALEKAKLLWSEADGTLRNPLGSWLAPIALNNSATLPTRSKDG